MTCRKSESEPRWTNLVNGNGQDVRAIVKDPLRSIAMMNIPAIQASLPKKDQVV